MPTIRLPLLNQDGSPAEGTEGGVSPAIEAQATATAVPEERQAPNVRSLEEEQEKRKGLMQVGDLARESGKTVRALHLYEELDLLRPVARSKGRYRLYGQEALLRIRWIGKLQDMGFSLTDIQAVVRDWEELNSGPKAMVKMREVFQKKLEETRMHLRQLQALERELESSLAYLDTCEVCDPARLISACNQCDLHDCSSHVPDLVAGFRAH